jgi:hypothetical protein
VDTTIGIRLMGASVAVGGMFEVRDVAHASVAQAGDAAAVER